MTSDNNFNRPTFIPHDDTPLNEPMLDDTGLSEPASTNGGDADTTLIVHRETSYGQEADTASQAADEAGWREALEARVTALEAELSQYKQEVEERFKIVEKKAGVKQLTAAERYFQVAEDS